MRTPLRLALFGFGALGLTGWLACGPSAGDIEETRAQYGAALGGFVVRQEPLPAADPSAPPRLEQDVELDLAVRREDAASEIPEGLPGITLDVEQVDTAGKSRRHWRVWVETAGLQPGRELRTGHVLEGVDYAPGDGFRVEVRRNIPDSERVGYLEWRPERGRNRRAVG